MDTIICTNCGFRLTEDKCPQCGYNMNVSQPFRNMIQDKSLKENVADTALALLVNKGLISLEKDLKHLVVEFGYLLVPQDSKDVSSLLKLMPVTQIFKSQRIYYIGVQQGKVLLLNDKFNEKMFNKISKDMLLMHKVNLNTIDKKEYIMELY